MSAAEANAMLARETGWPYDYVLSLDEYTKCLLLGWKPRKSQEEQDAFIRRQIASLTRRKPSG